MRVKLPLMGFSPWSSPLGDSHSTRNSAAPDAWTLNSRIRHHDEKSYGSVLATHTSITSQSQSLQLMYYGTAIQSTPRSSSQHDTSSCVDHRSSDHGKTLAARCCRADIDQYILHVLLLNGYRSTRETDRRTDTRPLHRRLALRLLCGQRQQVATVGTVTVASRPHRRMVMSATLTADAGWSGR